MATRLGTWAWVSPATQVFVPEEPFLTLPEDHVALPLRGYAHTCAVMGPMNGDGECECVGWCLVGISDGREL